MWTNIIDFRAHLRAFSSDVSSERIAGGFLLGIVIAITPAFTLHWFALFAAVLLIRINIPATLITWAFFSLFAERLDSFFHPIGVMVLTKVPALHPFWARLFHTVVVPFTRFSNSVVMGSLIVTIVIAIPLFFVLHSLVEKFQRPVSDFMRNQMWWNRLSQAGYFIQNRGLTGIWRYLRYESFLPLGFLGVVAWGYFLFFFDATVREFVERSASVIHGAKVDIGTLKTDFLKSEIIFQNIEIANRYYPEKNLFSVDKLRVHVDPYAVLRKKLLITDMKVEGVRIQTPRQTSGTLPSDTSAPFGVANVLDRVAVGFFADLRSEFKNNPLKSLDEFSTGLELSRTVQDLSAQLPTLKRINDTWQILDRTARSWEKLYPTTAEQQRVAFLRKTLVPIDTDLGRRPAAEDVGKALNELEVYQKTIDSRFNTVKTESEHLDKYLSSLTANNEIKGDIALVQEKLGLPHLTFKDLTPVLFGNKLVGYFEKLAYWIDLSRRRMPKGTDRIVAQPKARGVTFHFGKEAAYPAFFLMHATLSSDLADENYGGKLNAVVEGLTSDPSLWGRPLSIKFTADFPSQGIEGIKGDILVDHSKDKALEKVDIQVGSMPLNNWLISDSGTMRIGMSRGTVGFDFQSEFTEERLDSKWTANFKGGEYSVNCKYNKLEKLIRETLSPLFAYTLNGSVSGTYDKLSFKAKSEIGEKLASSLINEFRHEIGAIEDNVTKMLMDRIEPQTIKVKNRFEEMRSKALHTLETEMRLLEDIKRSATATAKTTNS